MISVANGSVFVAGKTGAPIFPIILLEAQASIKVDSKL
jgi:hypothetical protein